MSDQPTTPYLPPVSDPSPTGHPVSWWLIKTIRFAALLVPVFIVTGFLCVGLTVALGVAQKFGWVPSVASQANTEQSQADEIYTCPMHPQIRQPGEGRCPICGMPLVPATSGAADLDEYAVKIEPAQRRLANIQTAEATRQPVFNTIETIGQIRIDESRQAIIASFIDGRVERLFADYTGVVVDKGDHLAVVYSPQLYAAQIEYIESRRTYQGMNTAALASIREVQKKLVENARRKLLELGMTEEQIGELESSGNAKSRLTIYTSINGTVVDKFVEEGKYIAAGEPIYRIANLSTVWLMLELYPEDASQIRFGQIVKARLPSLPRLDFTGRVAFIDPTVDRTNRTVGVRVEFNNEDGLLRPGDYAQATIEIPIGSKGEVYDADLANKWISPMHPQIIRDAPGDCPICGMKLVPTLRYGYSSTPVAQTEATVIPRSALLMAGNQSVVYVETVPGRFELRLVKLGPILKSTAVVLSGVDPGEKVATSGNFLIDSQMQLAGKPSLIDPSRFIARQIRTKPLEFESINVTRIGGDDGLQLEALYQAYFEIQQTFAKDQKPSEAQVLALVSLAKDLAQTEAIDTETRQQFKAIEASGEHLHHLSLDEARQHFKPISHAVVKLATEIRGDQAKASFNHFFCPMVKQGEGDWLQSKALLSNPYYGSEMLRCGELVQTISPDAKSKPPAEDSAPHKHEHGDAANTKGEK